jgi:uncharacterized protein with HEPN domain
VAEYPEHEKLKAAKAESQVIGEFLENMPGGLKLCRYHAQWAKWEPTSTPINNILAEYFDIDLKKIEKERQVMLKELRASNEEDK